MNKRVLAISFVGLLIFSQIIAILPAPSASADDWNDANYARSFERVRTFIECSSMTYTDGHTALGDAKMIWHRKMDTLSWNNTSKGFPIGLSDLAKLDGNNDPNCQLLGPTVSTALLGSNTALLKHLYGQGSDGAYYLKAPYVNVKSDGADEPNPIAIVNELIKLAGAKGFPVDGELPEMYKRWVLNAGGNGLFKQCFHAVESGGIFTIPAITTNPGSKPHSYNYKNANVKDDEINVGFLIDAAKNGYQDLENSNGVWTCEFLAQAIQSDPAWFAWVDKAESEIINISNKADDAAERQRKIDQIQSELSGNQDIVTWCVVASGAPDAFTSLPKINQINAITAALIDGRTTISYGPESSSDPDAIPTIPPATTGASGTLDETITGALLSCIAENLPSIQEILEREVDYSYQSLDETETPGPSCENDGGVLAWIMCSVIDLLSSTFNWVDTQIQALLGIDKEKYTDDSMYKAWSSVRNLALAVLIIMMLVMVIGTALGTQLFDAYTVKRAMPRMMVAIIYIALSWWINVFLIDLSNAVGNGVLGLMTAPFSEITGDVTFASLFTKGTAAATGALGVGAALGIGVGMFAIPGATGIILSWIGTGLLIIGIAFLTLVLRQMFIVVLMLFAPVAILAWIFPGNDKLWKFWWGSFSKLLMMYPLIMALIAAGRIFSLSIGGTSDGILSFIIKISAYVIPYALIPLTFKFAGGAFAAISGMANDRSKGAFDRLKKGRQRNYHKAGGNLLQRRAELTGRMQDRGSMAGKSPIKRKLYRTGGRILGAGNVEAAMSARNAEEAKVINDQIATGRDDAIRGLTVNKKAIDAERAEDLRLNPNATAGKNWKIGDDGQLMYKTLGGAYVNEAAVVEGHQRWGKNQFAQQAALSYEMRKVNTREQVEGLKTGYKELATQQWGLSERQASGNWIGAGFENQGLNLEYKHTDWKTGETNVGKLADELYEKKGSYPMSQMHAHMFETLTDGFDDAAPETQQKIAAISETFVQRYGGTGGVAGMEGDVPIPQPGAVGGAPAAGGLLGPDGRPLSPATTARTVSGGPAAVGEAVNELARKTRRLYTPPPENHRGPDSSQST